jgi:hypothetical protein
MSVADGDENDTNPIAKRGARTRACRVETRLDARL